MPKLKIRSALYEPGLSSALRNKQQNKNNMDDVFRILSVVYRDDDQSGVLDGFSDCCTLVLLSWGWLQVKRNRWVGEQQTHHAYLLWFEWMGLPGWVKERQQTKSQNNATNNTIIPGLDEMVRCSSQWQRVLGLIGEWRAVAVRMLMKRWTLKRPLQCN